MSSSNNKNNNNDNKPFSSIPKIKINADQQPPINRSIQQMSSFNPFALYMRVQEQFGDIFRVIINANDGPVETVWVMDGKTSKEILVDEQNIYRKGKQTYEPFHSIVPMHLIGLEAEVHMLMRKAAQSALSDVISDGIVQKFADEACNKLIHRLHQIGNGEIKSWIGVRGENSNTVICTHVDKMFRGVALDTISGTIFGKSWNAIDDYSPTNIKADALARLMHELHWRVVDFNSREWRYNRLHEPVQSITNILESFVEDEIDKRLLLLLGRTDNVAPSCMLDIWCESLKTTTTTNSDSSSSNNNNEHLTREQIKNLCFTFLTMGHENIASALSWTLILLAENPKEQTILYSAKTLQEQKKALETCFAEATRLYPSVAGLTRQSIQTTTTVLGYEIPRSTEIAINLFALHRDSSIFGQDAEEFRPTSRCPVISTQGYPDATPFGVGSRSCIGRPLSYLELHTFVGKLFDEFIIESINNNDQKTIPNNFVSLRPGEHRVRFVGRHSPINNNNGKGSKL
jgi:cytochrome P450